MSNSKVYKVSLVIAVVMLCIFCATLIIYLDNSQDKQFPPERDETSSSLSTANSLGVSCKDRIGATATDPEAVQAESHWPQALDAYLAKDFAGAAAHIRSFHHHLVDLPQGCQLMVSVYAELREFDTLERVSQLCIDAEKGERTPYDGLAFSLVSSGRLQEAITMLERCRNCVTKLEVKIPLGNLYMMNGEIDRGIDLFLQALEHPKYWREWTRELVTKAKVRSDPGFLSKLIQVVIKKEAIDQKTLELVIAASSVARVPEDEIERLKASFKRRDQQVDATPVQVAG